MSKQVKISPALSAGLNIASGLTRLVPSDPDGPADELVRAIGEALANLAAAGAPDSDGGRILTRAEVVEIAEHLFNAADDIVHAALADEDADDS